MKLHIAFTHKKWSEWVLPTSHVIDMTAGNGKDTLALALLKPKKLTALDIQEEALLKAKSTCKDLPIDWVLASHADYPDQIPDSSIRLAVYNLGYLPGGDQSLTTLTSTTVKSTHKMLAKLEKGGALCITCYPGHPEGALEEKALLEWTKGLNPEEWEENIFSFRKNTVIWIQKKEVS